MVRTALADDHLQSYFTSIAKQNACTVGLILGQSIAGKDYVVHFAKTPAHQRESDDDDTRATIKTIGDINEAWVADHALQATKMLPGGMHVLGVFVASADDLLGPSFSPKIKAILSHTHKLLRSHKYLYGVATHTSGTGGEKLVLNYCTKTQQFASKSYDVVTASVKPVEFKFVPRTVARFSQFECRYDIDQIYHIVGENEKDWPLKQHMDIILDKINDNLNSSVFLFDGELKDADELIENIGKKKKVPRSSSSIKSSNHEIHHQQQQDHDANASKPLQVSILQLCNDDRNKSLEGGRLFKICESSSQIRILGQVVCKLWLNPKASIQMASEAIMQDIMRSLSTRLDMHWDSLTEEEHGEDVNSVHEPPRRVLVALPHSKITISDYLFPGEGAQDAQMSLEDMFDITVHNKVDIEDIEGQADLADYYNEGVMESDSNETILKSPNEANKSMYLIGLSVAVLVLIISLVIHFIQ